MLGSAQVGGGEGGKQEERSTESRSVSDSEDSYEMIEYGIKWVASAIIMLMCGASNFLGIIYLYFMFIETKISRLSRGKMINFQRERG